MKRREISKFLWKGIKGLLLFAILIYLLLSWKLKNGIDAFIESQPGNQTLEYYWLWIDWNASLYLKDVKALDENQQVMARAEIIKVQFESWNDLLSLNNLITYQRFPELMRIFVINGSTTRDFQLFDHLQASKLRFNKKIIPSVCREALKLSPTPFLFESSNEFRFEETAGSLIFQSHVETVGLANFSVSMQIDNLAYNDFNNAFISNFKLKANQLSWLQQSLNRCKTQAKLSDQQIVGLFSAQLKEIAKQNFFLLKSDFVDTYSAFIFSPQELTLSYDPQTGYRWQQLLNIPLHELKQKAGISLAINNKSVDKIFDTFDHLAFTQAKKVTDQKSAPQPQNSYLPVSFSGLSSFIGTQVVLNLDNKTSVQGVIEEVRANQLLLSQFKFGGKSILPYKFSNIRTIEVSQPR